MREGLKVMSGTKGEKNGSAFGKGIYFSSQSGISSQYSKYFEAWKKSHHFLDDLSCLLLCEIIDLYEEKPYFVVQEEDHVQVRFFFVFPSLNSKLFRFSSNEFPEKFPRIEGFNDVECDKDYHSSTSEGHDIPLGISSNEGKNSLK